MGWWDAGDGLLGGDEPLDAYGAAMDRVAARFRRTAKRLPSLHEIVRAFDGTAPREASTTYDALVRALEGDAPLLSARPRPLLTGELVAIPYAERRAVVALVLFGTERKKGEGPGYGACLVATELSVADVVADLDRVRTARWLTRPFHPGSFEGERVGRVGLEPSASFLPCFAWYTLPGSTGRSAMGPPERRRVFDYFGADVTGAPGVDARVIANSVGGAAFVAVGVRAALGLNREIPWAPYGLAPDADATPLASLPRLVRAVPNKPRKAPAPKPADAALLAHTEEVLADAARACSDAWSEAVGRAPKREELASALATVLSASAPRLLADPTRIEKLDRPRARDEAPSAAPSYRFDARGDVDVVRVEAGREKWSAFPFREGGTLVVETLRAPKGAIEHMAAILRTWRDARRLPHEPEPVIVRPMDWGDPTRTVA